jgi:uncharacterized membrane protein YesL
MNRLFNLDSPVMTFLSRVADLMILNIIWLVCCLPVVTIGASTTALYRVSLDLVDDRGSSVFKGFFAAFKANFKKATLLELILLVPTLLVAADLWILLRGALPSSILTSVACLLPAVILVFVLDYVWPLTAQFDNTLGGTVKNAALMSLAHLPVTLAVSLLNALPVIVFFAAQEFFWRSFLVWPLIGFAVIAYANTLLLRRVFKRYFPEEPAEKDGESDS